MTARRVLVPALTAVLVAGVTSAVPSDAAVARRPVIVLDPGHSRAVHAVDKRTGLVVSDYENEPEMHDVWRVANLAATSLRRAGYRVILTKRTLGQRRSLAQRAAVANRVHADLAVSIHDQAGRHGGIGFRRGNNIVYYQSVGSYRRTPSGRKVVFRDRTVAKTSTRYAALFAAERHRVQRAKIRTQKNAGYDLGGRGLAPGNMWLVQLLSRVPWIYNEAGGNSSGRVGLSAADRRVYAASLVAAVQRCVPIRR